MRTSPVTFNSSFFKPLLVSDTPGPSQPASQEQEPLIYSPQKHGRLNEFIGSADFKKFQEEYRAVLKSIKDFVHQHADRLNPPLSDENRKKVDINFDALEKRLFDPMGGGFDATLGAKENMYQVGKKMFHQLAELLQDKSILLQNRMDAILALTKRLEFCFGGIASDLSDVTAILMAYKCGLKGHVHQWKMEMLDGFILQHVKAHHRYYPNEEIHFVNAYYNHLAEEMGVEQRSDNSVEEYQKNIDRELLEACRRKVRAELEVMPTPLAANAAEHYHARIDEFLKKENIEADKIDEDGFDKLKAAVQALKPEYGDVSMSVLLEPDLDNLLLSAYIGKQQPVRGTRHFLKAFRNLGMIDYDKQSKVELGQIDEGRILMRDNLFWVKERKHAPVYELTASSLFMLAPEELLANIEKAEPEDMEERSFMLSKVVHHAYVRLTAEGNTGEQLDTWLRNFAVAMKERPSWPQGWTDLVILLAASFGRTSALRDLLEAGGDKNAVGENGRTVLMLAAQGGHVETVEALIEKGADIDAEDRYKRTALIWAAVKGDAGVVEALLEKGANKEVKDQYGGTALLWAVTRGHAGVVKALLKKGADIKAEGQDRKTALIVAAESGHAGIVTALLEKGADIEAKDQDGNTALIFAVDKGHDGVVAALLDKKANVKAADQYGNTPLILAAAKCHTGIVAALLEKGADIEAKDQYGNTALIFAAGKGHEEVVAALLDKKANVKATDQYGNTPLILAAAKCHAGIVVALLEKGADIEAKDQYGNTALQLAVQLGHVGMVEALLKAGADIEAKGRYGKTALLVAVDSAHIEAVEALLKAGANIEAKDEWIRFNALMWAAPYGHVETAKMLIQHGADGSAALKAIAIRKDDVEILLKETLSGQFMAWLGRESEAAIKAAANLLEAGADGATALLELAQEGRKSPLSLLIKAGADKARDAQGKTALMKAVEMTASGSDSERGLKVLKALLDAGADESIQDNEGKTAKQYAVELALSGNEKVLRAYIDAIARKKEGLGAFWR